jgi:hypothetical protein
MFFSTGGLWHFLETSAKGYAAVFSCPDNNNKRF